jgi:hypothetical protein
MRTEPRSMVRRDSKKSGGKSNWSTAPRTHWRVAANDWPPCAWTFTHR